MADEQWTPEMVQKMIMDPRNVGLGPYPPVIPEEDWIASNVKVLKELGPEKYLRQMIALLREASDLSTPENILFHDVNGH